MQPVPARGPVVIGADISHFQGRINWRKVKDAGIVFVFSKCTEYTLDDTYLNNQAGARANGIIFGAYDFFHPSRDPEAQAAQFIQRAKLLPGDLPPMMDWEVTDKTPAASDRANGRKWLDVVENNYGVKAVLYSFPYFFQVLALDASFSQNPFYVAHPYVQAPLVPAPFKNWTFWQKSFRGSIDGISAKVDMDEFNGDLTALKALTLR